MVDHTDETEFKAAQEKWLKLQRNDEFSYAPRYGKVAILHSTLGVSGRRSKELNASLVEYFEREAEELRKGRELLGQRALVIAGVNSVTLEQVLTNKEISDVIVIGNGTFSQVPDDKRQQHDWIDWDDVSRMANHLKRGRFIQRTCGNVPPGFPVPFPIFALSHHANAYSPVGDSFQPEDCKTEEERYREELKIKPVTQSHFMSFDEIMSIDDLYNSEEDEYVS